MSRKAAAKRTYKMRPPRPQPERYDPWRGLGSSAVHTAWIAHQDGEATPEQEALLDEFLLRGGAWELLG